MFLTPASIGYLTQLILAITIAGYFLFLSRRSRRAGHHTALTMLLAGAFTCFAYAILLLFLNASLHPSLIFFVMPLESVAVALFLVLILQFAYRFPAPLPGWKWEADLALGLTLLYLFWEGWLAGARYHALAQGVVRFRPPVADLLLLVISLWETLVFLRQTLCSSAVDGQAGLWRKLW